MKFIHPTPKKLELVIVRSFVTVFQTQKPPSNLIATTSNIMSVLTTKAASKKIRIFNGNLSLREISCAVNNNIPHAKPITIGTLVGGVPNCRRNSS
ncbi:hypothetical protein ES708_30745 [subsurface metagenome]